MWHVRKLPMLGKNVKLIFIHIYINFYHYNCVCNKAHLTCSRVLKLLILNAITHFKFRCQWLFVYVYIRTSIYLYLCAYLFLSACQYCWSTSLGVAANKLCVCAIWDWCSLLCCWGDSDSDSNARNSWKNTLVLSMFVCGVKCRTHIQINIFAHLKLCKKQCKRQQLLLKRHIFAYNISFINAIPSAYSKAHVARWHQVMR